VTLRPLAALTLLATLLGCGQLGFETVDVGPDFDGGPNFDAGPSLDGGPPVDAGPLSFDRALLVTNTDEVTLEGSCTGSAQADRTFQRPILLTLLFRHS
jgi:hypothetical protein